VIDVKKTMAVAARFSLGLLLALLSLEFSLWATGELWFRYQRSLYPAINTSQEGIRIMFLGESTTHGYYVGPEKAFPRQLEKRLNEKYKGRRYVSINLGIMAITTAQILRDFKLNMLRYRPQIVVLQAGHNQNAPGVLRALAGEITDPRVATIWMYINSTRTMRLLTLFYDYGFSLLKGSALLTNEEAAGRPKIRIWGNLSGFALTKAETEANLKAIIHACVKKGVPLVLCDYFDSDANPLLRRLSAEYGLPFCENEMPPEKMTKEFKREYLWSDQWHPSERGYARMAMNLLRTMEESGLVPYGASPSKADGK